MSFSSISGEEGMAEHLQTHSVMAAEEMQKDVETNRQGEEKKLISTKCGLFLCEIAQIQADGLDSICSKKLPQQD